MFDSNARPSAWIYAAPALVLAAMLAFAADDASAWEPDVHFGLTRWLALQAGFNMHQAALIARGDESVDDSWITGPVHGTIVSACMGQDPAGAAVMHDNHFPSKSDPPASPGTRAVVPGEVWREGTPRPAPPLNGTDAALQTLGRYLHALQDSWSHQSMPDVPPTCRAELGWGHALERGGWSCHLADLTYRWSDTDVPRMAQATYDTLRRALKKQPIPLSAAQRAKLTRFASARTKWQKDAWFKAEGFDDRRFLQELSLPDCELGAQSCVPYAYEQLVERWKGRIPAEKFSPADVPREIRDLIEAFFQGVVEQNGSIRTKELVDLTLARAALVRALHVEESCPQLYDALYEFWLGSGFVTGRGAQVPAQLCELAAALREKGRTTISCQDAVAASSRALDQSAARGPGLAALAGQLAGTRAFDYAITRDPTSNTYFATGRFVHLPRDILVAAARETQGRGPKIVGFFWLPSE